MKHLRSQKRKSSGLRWVTLKDLIPNRVALMQLIASLVISIGSIAVLLHIRSVARSVKTLASDGVKTFSPGQMVSDQAYYGLIVAFLSLLLIVIVGFLGRKRSSLVVLTAVFAVVSLGAAIFVFITFEQYKDIFFSS